MTKDQISIAIDNTFENVDRIWFSGGEPTIIIDKLLFGLRYAKAKKNNFGFPNKICIQTNGNFAKTTQEALKYLSLFYNYGANELDITSNDYFHFEQMDQNIPSTLANLANNMGIFERIIISGSDYKAVKKLGRAKNISMDELNKFDTRHSQKCVLTESDYVIYPSGEVIPCIYGFKNTLGNIYDKPLSEIISDPLNKEILDLLHNIGINKIINEKTQSNIVDSIDICDICNEFVSKYRKKGWGETIV
jgi:sulfatase maturation enzyme AslB (radical SAM superfamily)